MDGCALYEYFPADTPARIIIIFGGTVSMSEREAATKTEAFILSIGKVAVQEELSFSNW